MIPYRRILLATAMVLSGNAVFGQPAWTGLTTAGAPVPGRETPSAVYDPSTNRLIMFGGLSLEVASDFIQRSLGSDQCQRVGRHAELDAAYN